MPSAREELQLSLRREARRLLEEASSTTEPARRRPLLLRAFTLVQQAEGYRNLLLEDYPGAEASSAERDARRHEERAGRPAARLAASNDLSGGDGVQARSRRMSA